MKSGLVEHVVMNDKQLFYSAYVIWHIFLKKRLLELSRTVFNRSEGRESEILQQQTHMSYVILVHTF